MSVISWTKQAMIRNQRHTAAAPPRGGAYLSGDAAVLVEIVEVKRPVEFIGDGASQDDRQTDDEVLQRGTESKQTESSNKRSPS